MNEAFINMWVYAVQSGRITIELVPAPYKAEVKKIIANTK